MTRNAMAKVIADQIGRDSLDGIRHIDRPTWWLRSMISDNLEPGVESEAEVSDRD